MSKVYVLTSGYIDTSEPGSNESTSIKGVFATQESAIAKIEELHEEFRNFQMKNPTCDYLQYSCRIEEHKLIP